MSYNIPKNLPPLRKKIRRNFAVLIGVYLILGVFMVAAVFMASGLSPRIIHRNYDSIEASQHMLSAWAALRHSDEHVQKKPEEWRAQLEASLQFAEKNITEPGEGQALTEVRRIWDKSKDSPQTVTRADYSALENNLNTLIDLNEKGMFNLAEEAKSFGRNVFAACALFLFITVIFMIYLADGLATRLAMPLKDMAEALRAGADVGRRLKLPVPTSLEVRILANELATLWEEVSEFKKSNVAELTAQTQRLHTILSSVEDAILVLDNKGVVIDISDGMLKILGLNRVETLACAWLDLPTVSSNYLKLRELLTPKITADNVVELTTSDSKRAYAGRMRDIVSTAGQRVGQLYLLHDITEQRHRERLKSEFIGVLSHELKTPLQSLGTAAELLTTRKDRLDEESRMLVETVSEDVSRIRAVANDFMQVGLVDHHSLKLKMERVPLSQILQEWMKPFLIVARDKKVSLEFKQEGSDIIWAGIDTVKFPWAVSNLLSNALRVSPSQSKVTVFISDRLSTESLRLEIQDLGPGIPPHIQRHMFEPYFQGDGADAKAVSGFLGLGLTIAKEVVEAHEGKLEYFANKPQGSVFRITLPSVVVIESSTG